MGATLLAGALVLTGCVSPREVPAPMSEANLRSYIQGQLDAAWLNTGLDGTVRRPESDPATLVDRYNRSTYESMYMCMSDQGIETWGTTEENGGPKYAEGDGKPIEPAEQLTWYSCFAENPASTFGSRALSRAELDYLYDYYQEWIVPCLELKGYAVGESPTRAQFWAQGSYIWIPYNAIAPGLVQDPYGFGLSFEQMLELADQCGDPFPGMDYGEEYGF